MSTLSEKANTSLEKPTFGGDNVVEIRKFLSKWSNQISLLIPSNIIDPNRLVSIISQVVYQNRDLAANTTKISWVTAALECAQTGLDPTPSLGLCAFIPYGRDVKFQMQYKGIVRLIRQSGNIKRIEANVIYKNDFFEFEFGDNAYLKFKPAMNQDRGEKIGVYALVEYSSGGREFVVLDKTQVEKHKNASKAKKSNKSPWNEDGEMGDWVDVMWLKSAIRELARFADFNTTAMKAIEADKSDVKTPDKFIHESAVQESTKDAEFEVVTETKKSWPEMVESYLNTDMPKECYDEIIKAGFSLNIDKLLLKKVFLEKEAVLRPILEKYL